MNPPSIGLRVATVYLPTGAAVETRLGTVDAVDMDGWEGHINVKLDDIGDGGFNQICRIENCGITWSPGGAQDTRTALIASYLLWRSAQ